MQLVIISGPPGAGKTAAAEALCERYDRMLHIEMSRLRDFLKMGRLRPWDRSPEGRRQLRLFVASACDIAQRFLDAGYGVVIDDVISSDELPLYQEALAAQDVVHFVVLLPELDVIMARKDVDPRQRGRIAALHEGFASWDGVAIVRPEDLPPRLVADRIMALAGEGVSLISKPAPA